MSSENYHKGADFTPYRIYRKKRGVCTICGFDIYYGIAADTYGHKTIHICSNCAKIIMRIRLSPWCC